MPVRIALILVVVFVVSYLVLNHEFATPENSKLLSSAQFSACDASDSREVALPHNWRSGTQDDLRCGEYTVDLGELTHDDSLAVLLPIYRYHVSVQINGYELSSSTYERNQVVPFYHVLQPFLLTEHHNKLVITMLSSPDGEGFLDSVIVGPADYLLEFEQKLLFWRVTVPQLLAVVVVIFVCLSLLLYVTLPNSLEYLFFSIFASAWVVHMLNLIWMDPAIPGQLWMRIVFTAVLTLGSFGCLFVSAFLKFKSSALEKWIFRLWCLWVVINFTVPFEYFLILTYYVMTPYTLLLAPVSASYFLRSESDHSALSMVASLYLAQILSLFVIGAHDVLLMTNLIDDSIVFYLHYSAALLILCIGSHMVIRYMDLVRSEQRYSAKLERDLAIERARLEKSMDYQRSTIEKNAALKERDNLMRDLHDSLGARLISLVRLTEDSSRAQDLAQESLDELRFIAAPLRDEQCDLVLLLATFRERRLARHEADGFIVQWNIGSVDDLPVWNLRQASEFLRILDELLGNTLKHGAGNTLTIALRESDRLTLEFVNPVNYASGGGEAQVTNGTGSSGAQTASICDSSGATKGAGKGAGLKNLSLRCARIGASITQRTEHGLYRTTLTWAR